MGFENLTLPSFNRLDFGRVARIWPSKCQSGSHLDSEMWEMMNLNLPLFVSETP
jgi:hypothetical protein